MSSRWALVSAACGLLLAATAPAVLSAAPPHVLVLYSKNRLLPANIESDGGLRESIGDAAELSAEFLDYPRFSGDTYLSAVTGFLRDKCAARPPQVLVAGGAEALGYLVRRHGELFPKAPVVQMGVPTAALPALPPLPADVVGVPFDLAFAATLDQALRWHPRARRLVLITGASALDLAFEAELRVATSGLQGRAEAEFLAGLPSAELLPRLANLDGRAIIFTPGYFRDGAGRNLTPARRSRAWPLLPPRLSMAPSIPFWVRGSWAATCRPLRPSAARRGRPWSGS